MKNGSVLILLIMLCGTSLKAQQQIKVTNVKPGTLTVADSKLTELERRLDALEQENKNLKAQVADLQNKLNGSVFLINASITKTNKDVELLRTDFMGHTHSLNTHIKVNGGYSFSAAKGMGKMFFVTGESMDKNLESGPAIIK